MGACEKQQVQHKGVGEGHEQGYVREVVVGELQLQLKFKQQELHRNNRRCSRCHTCCFPGSRTSTRIRAPGLFGYSWMFVLWIFRDFKA